MTNEEAIKLLEGIWRWLLTSTTVSDSRMGSITQEAAQKNHEAKLRMKALEMAIKAMRKQGNPWTPISEEEPPKNTPVWVTIKQREGWKPAVVPGVLHEDGWEIIPSQTKEYTVTAWSPFLEPYQGDENG